MAPQSEMRAILSVDAFAKIEVRLTPRKISMISLDRFDMRDEYDFSQSVPNPYLKKLKKR
jgi:hypothetical protein